MGQYRMKPNTELIEAEAARIRAELEAMATPNSPNGTHYCVKLSHEFLMNSNSNDHFKLITAISRKAYLSKLTSGGFDGYYLSIHKDTFRGKSPSKRKSAGRERCKD